MLSFTAKIFCPFCFQAFPPQAVHFRCLSAQCTGRAKDTTYAEARGYNATVMGHVILPTKRSLPLNVPNRAVCDICHTTSYTHLCPYCHFELSHDVGLVDQRIIAIIGARATGKTHYIAALITRLQHEVGKNFNLSLRILGDSSQERWLRDFYTPLFVHKTVLQPNQPAEVDPQVKSPLIFRLTCANGNFRRVLNISFFDSAGEDLTSITTMSLQNRYIAHADGIVFLLDPLQIPSVRQKLPAAHIPPADANAVPEHMVSRVRDLFEREHKLRVTQKVKIPIAFTLSKVDTLFPLLEPGSEFYHRSRHYGYLDLNDIQSVHTEVANYLSSWIDPNFCNVIHNSFAYYNYFAVSSLGEQPDNSNHLSSVIPLRVEDPFLWLLYQFDLIKGKKRKLL